MREFAGFAEEAEAAIEKGDIPTLAELMENVRSNIKIAETCHATHGSKKLTHGRIYTTLDTY